MLEKHISTFKTCFSLSPPPIYLLFAPMQIKRKACLVISNSTAYLSVKSMPNKFYFDPLPPLSTSFDDLSNTALTLDKNKIEFAIVLDK